MGEWKLVPVEPTPEMSAFKNTGVHFPLAERIYAAMLAAAPSPEWVKTSERLPTREDADERGDVWGFSNDGAGVCLTDYEASHHDDYWMPRPRQQSPEPPR